MLNQTFKSMVPLATLDTFLKEGCERKETYYVFNTNAYKRLQCKDLIQKFVEEIVPHYHASKKHYVLRPLTLKRLLTVIRQICRLHNVPYVSKLVYVHSSYDITYYIYLPTLCTTSS